MQVCTVDLPVETELSDERAHPVSRCLTRADVVVLTPVRDRLLVVARVRDGELPHGQHAPLLHCTGLYTRYEHASASAYALTKRRQSTPKGSMKRSNETRGATGRWGECQDCAGDG